MDPTTKLYQLFPEDAADRDNSDPLARFTTFLPPMKKTAPDAPFDPKNTDAAPTSCSLFSTPGEGNATPDAAGPPMCNVGPEDKEDWRVIAPPGKRNNEGPPRITRFPTFSGWIDNADNFQYRSPLPALPSTVIWNNQYDDYPQFPPSPFIYQDEKFCSRYPFYNKRDNWLFTGNQSHQCTGGIGCESWRSNGFNDVPFHGIPIECKDGEMQYPRQWNWNPNLPPIGVPLTSKPEVVKPADTPSANNLGNNVNSKVTDGNE